MDFQGNQLNLYGDHQINLMGLSEIDNLRGELIDTKEKLLKKQYEIAILESLTTDFAMVRDKSDLVQMMGSKLQTLFSFGHNGVAMINEDGCTITPLFAEAVSSKHPRYNEKLQKKHPINDGVLDRTLNSAEPQTFDLRQLAEKGEIPEYFLIQLESGIGKAVLTRLCSGKTAIGIWAILFTGDEVLHVDQLYLVKYVSHLMATALSNVLAYEDIERRQKEREIVYSLSNDIATARTSDELMTVIREKMKGLLGFSNTGMTSFDKDHPDYPRAASAVYPIGDDVFDRAITSEKPLVFPLDDEESGHSELCITRLCHRGEVVGFWMLYYARTGTIDNHRLGLIEGLASQLSVAVSNIMVNAMISKNLQAVNHQRQQMKDEKGWDIIGGSKTMDEIFQLVRRVAEADSTVLLTGETGTGKELIARAIHNNSPRRQKLMVKVNCAALPANLIESELFGHERGSFTGAVERRIGKFELAHEGTLFLDEIGEMPLELQGKLLRAIQEKEVERIGGKTTIKVNVRIVAATNRQLEIEMAAGRFRSDLYYRINIFPIQVPPLRERKEEIPLLAAYFIRRHAKKTGRRIDGLSATALRELLHYDWPGNVRELENLLERSVLLASGNTIEKVNLPMAKPDLQVLSKGEAAFGFPEAPTKLQSLADNEKEHILNVLKFCGERVSGKDGAALILGIPPSTLVSRMKRLGITKAHVNRK
jgi:formate hydrogenlyase transcriptional activator